ncbi:hypothetical protein GCM10009864_80640 [Streptomyces lunalinharesii]|uniref:Transposase IS4-like domain-containing protein n=1 Tax=Streptomyces lunalinharesii TaxID=333384 RepID=A0ABN3T6C1_9ACTN
MRWVVERAFAWLHQFKRLRIRYERRADLRQGRLGLACSLICLRRLRTSFRNDQSYGGLSVCDLKSVAREGVSWNTDCIRSDRIVRASAADLTPKPRRSARRLTAPCGGFRRASLYHRRSHTSVTNYVDSPGLRCLTCCYAPTLD